MKKLAGKVAIVTGGASGIGLGSVKRLVEDGAAVVVADLNEAGAQQIVEEIKQNGGQAIAVGVDVADEEAMKAMIAKTIEAFGKIDILFNNAGFGHRDDKDLLSMDTDLWDKMMAVNVRGPMFGAKYAIPEMLKNGGGVIINNASGNAKVGDYERTAYSAAKAGLLSLTRSIATQYGKDGIRCNSILPGLILTPATRGRFSQELMDLMEEGHLTPYVGEPEDIGALVSFLASDDAKFITGQEIPCDGGVNVRSAASGIMKHVQMYGK
ncbi:SDR family NAD(P)-dependent oxidoreductase [Paenibacillus sp. EC2-1]|uniref:SDR family NAD(P)-dependent oxidoreductase n=1 Tax=Paenibacillus sp. EC2-1 TaxID=3388665 RepID=UPI003BEECD8B